MARLMLFLAILSALLAVLGWVYAKMLSTSASRSRIFFASVGFAWLVIVPLFVVVTCPLMLRGVVLPAFPHASSQDYHVTVYRNNRVVDAYDETRTDKGPVVFAVLVLGYSLLLGWSWVTLGIIPVVYGFKSRGDELSPAPKAT